jgi:hypothetical protein
VNRRVWSSKQLAEAVQSAVGDGRRKKSAGEDLRCDLKTLSVLQYSDIRSLCAVGKRTGTSAVRLGAVSEKLNTD